MRLIVMGVSGSGKTAVGKALGERLQIPFYDGDDFHSRANIEKMTNGIPLTDADRWPWLEALAHLLKETPSMILACSALKASYRERLKVAPDVRFIYLKGSYSLIEERLKKRRGHFFNPDLLKSQFADLEEPKDALDFDINISISEIVNMIQNCTLS